MQEESKLPKCLYEGDSIPEILRLYESELRKDSDDFKSIAHAGAIRVYHNLITDKQFLSVLRREFDCLYSILEKEIPDLRFIIDGRRKSLISSEKKILRLLRQNRSLDLFRDMFAFRIVIWGKASQLDLIEKCYSVMNNIINFYVRNGYTLCEEDLPSNIMDNNSPELQNIIVPKTSTIAKEYLYGVKDYILHPKDTGYQSLHCVFRTKNGFCFEIQVRTLEMDTKANKGEANHSLYKKKKYADMEIEFDRNKIHVPGYFISENGILHDLIGLEKPLLIIHRQKTF